MKGDPIGIWERARAAQGLPHDPMAFARAETLAEVAPLLELVWQAARTPADLFGTGLRPTVEEGKHAARLLAEVTLWLEALHAAKDGDPARA